MSEAIALRPAVATDALAIRDLTRAAYAKWVPVIGREPKPMTADYAQAVRNHRFDLLHVDGALAALIETIPQTDHLLIENVAVSPDFQGRGLGRKLLAHAEDVAASMGYDQIKLYTNKLFAANVLLYARLGYVVEREERSSLGVAVHMRKPVRSRVDQDAAGQGDADAAQQFLAQQRHFRLSGAMIDSPYHFPAASHPLHTATDRLKIREAVSPFGITLRYQERAPDPQGTAAADDHWCETGHSIFILAGRIRYIFDDHVVEAGPGDMLHIPAGPAHRHRPSVLGEEVVRYVLTEFT